MHDADVRGPRSAPECPHARRRAWLMPLAVVAGVWTLVLHEPDLAMPLVVVFGIAIAVLSGLIGAVGTLRACGRRQWLWAALLLAQVAICVGTLITISIALAQPMD